MRYLILLIIISLKIQLLDAQRYYEWNDSTIEFKDWYIGGGVSIGYGLLNNNLSENFTNDIKIGLNLDTYYKDVLLQLDISMGFNKAKNVISFDGGKEWQNNQTTETLDCGINIGYPIIDNLIIRSVPFGGFSFYGISIRPYDPDSDEVYVGFFDPRIKIGLFSDFKQITIVEKYRRINNEDYTYGGLRISIGYSIPLREPKYEYFIGSYFYLTLGFGGFSKLEK